MCLIANGRFVRLEACRSVDEHGFIAALTNCLRREDSGLNIRDVLRAAGKKFDKDTTTWQGKLDTWDLLAKEIIEGLTDTS